MVFPCSMPKQFSSLLDRNNCILIIVRMQKSVLEKHIYARYFFPNISFYANRSIQHNLLKAYACAYFFTCDMFHGFKRCLIHSVELGICVNHHTDGTWIEKALLSFCQGFQVYCLFQISNTASFSRKKASHCNVCN